MSEQIMILKNDKGEDIYSIDKSGKDTFIIPLKSSINILEPLTIYNRDKVIGNINMCEILLGSISDILDDLYDEKSEEAYKIDEARTDILDKIWNPTPVTINPELDSFRTSLTIKYNQYQGI